MQPVSPASDDDHLHDSSTQPPSDNSADLSSDSQSSGDFPPTTASATEDASHEAPTNKSISDQDIPGQVTPDQNSLNKNVSAQITSTADSSTPAVSFSGPSLTGQIAGSLANLQRRYTDQLSQDIEQLEAKKAQLESEISDLQAEHARLSTAHVSPGSREDHAPSPGGPRLPGESSDDVPVPTAMPTAEREQARALELPTPATSEQRRRISIQLREPSDIVKVNPRKGLVLSAIATALMAWHYSVIATLGQGGLWLGLPIGELGAGFVPAVALLWLRMLVAVPVLGLLAPQLYKDTWDNLRDWIYNRDQLLVMLIGSGVALFFSQVLIYQCVGVIGAVLGTTLLFLYPLTAMPLGIAVAQEQKMTPLGLLSLIAITMGGILAARPLFVGMAAGGSVGGWLGLGASLAFSLYIVLTKQAYRQQCHPIPVGVVQFSTVAVISSLVLLIKPLRLANISWVSFTLWGMLLGIVMMIVYLLTYSSLRMIGPRTAIVAAATPLVTAVMAIGFSPWQPMAIVQWTGVFMVALGGIALGKERLSSRPQ